MPASTLAPALPAPATAPLAQSLRNTFARIEHARPPQAHVENRVAFGAENAQLAIYDTFLPAEHVPFSSSHPLFCGMVTGKKLIHTIQGDAIPLLPEESLVVPAGQTIHIDFPEASFSDPTKCLTLEIDRTKVDRVVDDLNTTAARSPDSGEWRYTEDTVCHLHNSPGLDYTVGQLVRLFAEDHPERTLLIDLNVQELVVRMLRLEARRVLLDASLEHATTHRLAAAVAYARQHLNDALTVGDLATEACMSEPTFYRHFQNEFGQTPLAFLTEERIRRARRLLADERHSVTDVAAAVGFSSISHFIRLFRRHVGQTPKQYQLQQRPALAD